MGYQDLCMILGGFIQIMDELSEYLLNPERLVVKPEFMYVDLEKRQLYFCYLPGYAEDIRQKFQELTEYILPKLDHEDQKAVMLGYGVYRRALEDSFHLEHIKRELYQEREEKEIGWKNLIEKKTDEKQILSDDIYEENRRTKKENGKEDEMLKRDENLEKLSCEDELIWYESEPKEDKKRGKKHIYSEMAGMLTGVYVRLWQYCGYCWQYDWLSAQTSGAGRLQGYLAAMGIGMVWVVLRRSENKRKRRKTVRKSELAGRTNKKYICEISGNGGERRTVCGHTEKFWRDSSIICRSDYRTGNLGEQGARGTCNNLSAERSDGSWKDGECS